MKRNEYSQELANVVTTFLNDDDWRYRFDEERGVIEFGLNIQSELQRLRFLLDIGKDEIVVYGICPIGALSNNAAMMAQMAEFICRSNYGLRNGNFELDFRDGEIRYKSFIDCDGNDTTPEIVRNSVHCTAAMYRRYAPGITGIIFGNLSAKEAVDKCEGKTHDELHGLLDALRAGRESSDSAGLLSRLASALGIDSDSLEAHLADSDSADSDDETQDVTDLFDE